ncbi:MAG: prepilin peptidase [Bauldia sp.]|nr:prepilin peptidase [Bauldia sp.]MCW5717599.1 prepilin peptidase [Bauldia sp.]
MDVIDYAIFAFFPLVMAYAATSDVLTMTIPNRVSLIGIAGFAIAAPLAGLDIQTIGLHAAAGAAVLVGGFLMFAARWIGGGDAKVAAVAALWLGLDHTLEFLLQGALFGGTLTIFIILARRRPLPAFAIRPWILRLHDPASGVPYCLALAAAALVIYPKTVWIGLVA